MKKISMIIPSKNEINNSFFKETIRLALELQDFIELIIIDAQSSDGTLEFLDDLKISYRSSSSNSRGERLDIGARLATTDLLLFNHPRSSLSKDALLALADMTRLESFWGGFYHSFDIKSPLLNFTSWYSNNIRAKIREIIYLDHCLFVSKDLYLRHPFFKVDIFEDTLISLELNKIKKPILLNFQSKTSSIRFQRNGMFKQAIMNQFLKVGFMLRINDKTMNKIYEFGINLNSKY